MQRVSNLTPVDCISASAALPRSEGGEDSEGKETDSSSSNVVQCVDRSGDFISFPEEIDTFRYVHSLARMTSKDIASEGRFLSREIARLSSAAGNDALHALVKERLQKVSEYAEKIKSSLTADLFSQTLQTDSLLPSSGFVVVEVRRGSDSSSQASLWLKVEAQLRTLSFHDRGPGSVPLLVADVAAANLHIPKLSESEDLFFDLVNCKNKRRQQPQAQQEEEAEEEASSFTISFKFCNVSEFWRWSVSLGSVCNVKNLHAL